MTNGVIGDVSPINSARLGLAHRVSVFDPAWSLRNLATASGAFMQTSRPGSMLDGVVDVRENI